MKQLRLTDDIRLALNEVNRLEEKVRARRCEYSAFELAKIALADALVAAVAEQHDRRTTRIAKLNAIGRARPAAVADTTTRAKRRRA